MFDPLYYLGVFVFIILVCILLILGVMIFSLKYFPTSKLSEWSRRNVITDEDLEQP